VTVSFSKPVSVLDASIRVLLSRAVQLPSVHTSDAEPGPDLFPGRDTMCGSVTVGHRRWADGKGFPPDTDVELLVEGGDIFQGRFLMTPVPRRAARAREATAGGRVREGNDIGAFLAEEGMPEVA
jgi:hypothetical protein